MHFSEHFKVSKYLLNEYGAVDISLACDIPLFVDPMLIFNSEKDCYKKLHERIIRYFHFLYKKASQGLSPKEIDAWFNFSEVSNNWLGYSLVGNKGNALGKEYAQFLYNNISFAIDTHGITQSPHIEKVMLLYAGTGKDKISDLTVNLIKDFLCEYTEKFAVKYINNDFISKFPVERADFNYDTESFICKEYNLPFIYNNKGKKEFVLLTPQDILREDEPAINKKDFYDSYERICLNIENDTLRAYVNNYISKAVQQYENNLINNKRKKPSEKSIRRVEKNAFKELVQEHKELYDYYIRLREIDKAEICSQCSLEREKQIEKFISATESLIDIFLKNNYIIQEELTAQEESKRRLKYFKHIIENCDGYKHFYQGGKRISNEKDIQRLSLLVWYGTNYKISAEANNGRGPVDFIVSMGQNNQCIIEFKLASNKSLAHMFTQVKVYEAANCADGSLFALFYFSEEEYQYSKKVVKEAGYENLINESIILIDCRNDNKKSASKA